MKEVEEPKALTYWKKEIKKAKESEKFIWNYCKDTAYNKRKDSVIIGKEYGIKLSEICKNNRILIYTYLVSTLNINLSLYTYKKNITVGIPCYNADDKKNFTLNKILPLTSFIDYEKTYLEYMMSIKEQILETYKNQSYLNSNILLENNLSNNILDLTSINICMKDIHQDKHIDYICSSSKNELSFLLELLEDKSIKIDIVYNDNKLSKSIVEKLSRSYMNVLKEVLNNYNQKIKHIKILSEEETNKILYEFNDTEASYPKDKTIQELFEEQVDKAPDNIAVLFEDKKLTYRELNEKSNQLAMILRNKGVEADSIVGIMVERSLQMIIGIMGILKAGAAYLPIDPSYPKERIEYMLNDSESNILLSTESLLDNIRFDGQTVDLFNEDLYKGDLNNLEKINDSNDLAYVIYTSGTTGKPKGTMIEHKSLVNRLNWMQNNYPLNHKDVILQKTTCTFDVSVWEILWWSIVGAKVCMLSPNEEKNPKKIIEAIDRYGITTMHFVPSMLDVFLYCVEENRNITSLPSLRQVFSSGEALNFKQVSKFYKELQDGKKLINLYGPTEATIDVSYFDCSNEDMKVIPIGKPIDNIKLYILKNNEIVPIGATGELYISGAGVARGYINRFELTAEKFVNNPFEIGSKMYRTGDLARWLPDGNIEFLGRIDNQVKIRGFRIELGEIENELLLHESMREVAVLVKENKENEKYICAYVVSEKSLNDLSLKSYLKETLPEYMIPSYFIQLEKMPLTTNGKIDRKALPEVTLESALNEYEAPRNELEETLALIWSEVLGIKKIGINDDFFELGGHSLKATVLLSKIHKALNKEIPLKELFRLPTIKKFSQFIEKSEENLYLKIKKVEEREYYEASSAQKRMYMLNQFDKDSLAYNMPMVFQFEGVVSKELIEETFKKLSSRHEVLRSYFKTIDGEIVQLIDNSYEFILLYRQENEEMENITNKFVRPFILEKGPLFRVELVESYDKTYLLIDMHHIISDGTSMSILMKDFAKLYNQEYLHPLHLQYKDFATWQNKLLKSKEIEKQEMYWIERFSDELPVLNLQYDYERSVVKSFAGDSINFDIDNKTTEALRKLAKETGTTMYMILLSGLNILLSKYSGQEDIIIGSPIAGRKHEELENIMGMFVNTLPMRNYPFGNKTYEEFLTEVKENSIKAYENQYYQFEELVDRLNLQRDSSRNPLFDVMLILQNMEQYNVELSNCCIKQYPFNNKTSKFDLLFAATELKEKICFELQYCSKIFRQNTVKKMSERFKNILDIIINNRYVKISEIDVLFDDERKKVLFDFNNTEILYDDTKTIQELFEEQVEKTPNNIALVFKNKVLTYKELNESSNNLANYLFYKGCVKDNTKIGIFMERSEHMIIAILGILKAGAAYVPIDSQYPIKRVKTIIEDCGINTIISRKKQIPILNKLQWECQEFKSYLCIDSYDIYNLEEVNNNSLMNEELWNYVVESSSNKIGEGGWKSSYTGEEFSLAEMQEYSDNTLYKLKPYLNKNINVLEIGCASGLTMFDVASHVKEYYGTDMSNVVIEKNKKRVIENCIENIKLKCLQAHKINEIENRDFDVIIINSVIQYFPGYNYLRYVIEQSINLLKDKGVIYIGDIMDSELKEDLIESLIIFKNENKSNENKTKIEFDSELFVSREYFEDLAVDFLEIDKIEFSKKIHTIENELTRFRYDCIIEVNKAKKNKHINIKHKYQHGLKDLEKYNNMFFPSNVRSNDVAYVIYTSGSTGKPKGVEIQHKAVVNFINGITSSINFMNKNAILSATNISFDIFVLETLLPLSVGLKIVIADEEEQMNPRLINKLLHDWNIDILQATPSRMQMILTEHYAKKTLRNLKAILIGGEPFKETLLKTLKEITDANIYNMYGPTETTVWSTFSKLNFADKITIGTPINNTQVYILDKYKNLVPIGVIGELHISGDGLARGYLNTPQLTAEKFINNPFKIGTKMYKTGDLARWLSNGDIEHLGRIDSQVKIRGFRIELGEIENLLLQHKDIKETVVVAKEDNEKEKYICAFVVSKKNINELNLKEYLKVSLPEYMIPSYIVQLDNFPLTYNGKLNTKALPEPYMDVAFNEYEAPTNDVEEKLAQIWCDELGLKKVGISDNFFAVGGHSLKAIMLTNRIQKELGVEILLQDILRAPTIKGIGELILNKKHVCKFDFKQINQALIQRFGPRVKLIKYVTEVNVIIILFCDENFNEIINFLKKDFSNSVTPNYICGYIPEVEERDYTISSTLADVNKNLNLKKIYDKELSLIIENVEINYNNLKNRVISQLVKHKYKIGVIMNKRCQDAHVGRRRPMISHLIYLGGELCDQKINETFLRIVNDQSVFRTTVIKEEEFLFQEYDKVKGIDYQIIDISSYDYESKEIIIKNVSETINNMIFSKYLDNLLYGFAIFKIDLNNFLMILNMDHQISDISTPRIIKEYFYSNDLYLSNITPYNQYISDVWLTNTDEKFCLFKASNIYNEFRNSVQEFSNRFPQYGKGQKITFSKPMVISCSNVNLQKGWITAEESHMKVALFVAVKLISKVFDLDVIPFRIYTNNRILKSANYYYTVGDFTDYTPCTFTCNDNVVDNYYNKYLETKNELIDKDIQMKSVGNYDEEYLELMFKRTPFTLNYIGEISELESVKAVEAFAKNNRLGIPYPILVYSVGSSKLNFLLYNGLESEGVCKIKEIFNSLDIKATFNSVV